MNNKILSFKHEVMHFLTHTSTEPAISFYIKFKECTYIFVFPATAFFFFAYLYFLT